MNLRTKILLANLMLIASLSAMELPENEEANDSRPAGTTEINAEITELKAEDGAEATTEKGEVIVNEEEQPPTKTGDATAVEEETTPEQELADLTEKRSKAVSTLMKMLGKDSQKEFEISLPDVDAPEERLIAFLEINKNENGEFSIEDQEKLDLLKTIVKYTKLQIELKDSVEASNPEIQTLNGDMIKRTNTATSDDNKKSDDKCDEPEQQRPNCMERVAQFLWNPLEGMKHLFWAASQRISGKMKLN